MRITLRAYFRRFTYSGRRNLPKAGPAIFVANHPSAFMDPLIIGSMVKQTLHFISAAEYFGKGLKAWIYRNWFHMIPVYRPNTQPGQSHKNSKMFDKCYSHLAKGGSMLIFPEGNSITEKRLRELKTGVSRIALGAEAENEFGLDIKVVPIGLNYSNPHRFRSDLFVRIEEPIVAIDYKEEYLSNEREAVRKMTQDIEERLQNAIVHIGSIELDSVVDKVYTVYKRDLKREMNIGFDEQHREFKMQKDMVQAIEHYQQHQPEKVKQMESKLDSYLANLRQAHLSDRAIKGLSTGSRWGDIVVLIIGFPLFLLGLVHNYIPYSTSDAIARKLRDDSSFSGSVTLATGFIVFLVWYIGLSIGLVYLTHSWWLGLLHLPLMYLTGLHALRYLVLWAHIKQRQHLNSEFRKNSELIAELILERKAIVEELESYREALELKPQE